MTRDRREAELASSAGGRRGLAGADLEHEPAAGREHVDGAPRRPPRPRPPRRAPRAAPSRAPPAARPGELGRVDVRRVRDDEIPGPGGQAREEVVSDELDRRGPSRAAFSAASASALRGDVDRRHPRARVLVGDRERDRAGARADVEHARRVAAGEQAQGPLDEDLRLGSRDQRARVDRERQAPEPPLAEDVLERLARARRATSARAASSSAGVSGRSSAM